MLPLFNYSMKFMSFCLAHSWNSIEAIKKLIFYIYMSKGISNISKNEIQFYFKIKNSLYSG